MNVKPETAPYQAHSETSREAAEAIERPLTKLRLEVLRAIQDAPGGLTDQEIQDRLGMDPSTERPRRVELVEQRLVVDSGETRETRAGRRATVWRVR